MAEPFQAHIQRLMRAGIATHMVASGDAVDPLFALSKVRDFPEVTFAAVFEDGVVVLGCKGSLPEPLQGLAKPIVPQEGFPDNTLEAKIDALAVLINERNSPAEAVDFNGRLASLSDLLIAQSKATDSVKDRLSQIDCRITSLGDQTLADISQAMPDLAPLTAGFDLLRNEVAKTLAQNEDRSDLSAADEFATLLADFEARQQALLLRTPEATSLAEQTSEIANTQRMLQANIADMALDLKALTAMQGVEAANTDSGTAEAMAQLEARLDQLAAMDEKITAMSSELTAVSQRPDPVIDLTAQRQSLARFETAMSTALGRLESETVRIATYDPAAAAPDLVDLPQQMATISGQLAQIAELSARLDNMDAALQTVPEQQRVLNTAVAELGQRPDPVLDLTEQRRSFAQFATALGAAITRLENISQGETPKELTALVAQLEDLADQTSDAAPDPALSELLARQQEEFAALRQGLAEHLQRPGPVLDLTQQRTSLAQFGTALGAMLARFERVASKLEEEAQKAPPATIATDAHEAETQTEPTFDTQDIPLETMRFSFAELIAKQIMKNAETAPDGTPCSIGQNH